MLPYGTVFAIMHLYKRFFVVVVLCLSISFFIFSFSLVSINWNVRRYQHVLAVSALLTGVILKGLTLRKFVSDVCVYYVSFHVCEMIGFVD